MPSLIQRSNGYFYLVTHVNGRRVWQPAGAKTKSDALKFIAEKKREI